MQHRKICALVDQVCLSGKEVPDSIMLGEIKSVCRISEGAVRSCVAQIFVQLEKKHAQIRLSALHILHILFVRSHVCRSLVAKEFQKFLAFSIALELNEELPPPKKHADILRAIALQHIYTWNKEFGDGYKQLRLGFIHLQTKLKVDFSAIAASLAAEQNKVVEQKREEEKVKEDQLHMVKAGLEALTAEVDISLAQITNCIAILVPIPASPVRINSRDMVPSFDINTIAVDQSTLRTRFIDEMGLGSRGFSLDISLPSNGTVPIEQNADTVDIIQVLHENQNLVKKKYLPLLRKLAQKLDGLVLAGVEDTLAGITEVTHCR